MSEFQLPARRRIYLMRHGDVTYFDASGDTIDPDTVPLNERGRAQASAAGREFAAQAIRFDRVIVSGLERTVETAERVLAETGQLVELEVQPAWREIRGGGPGTIAPDQMESAFLRVFEGIVPEHTQFLGGETVGSLLDRVLPQIDALRAEPSWDTVLLVLHGGVNRAILSHAITTGGRTFFGHLAQATGCINALDVGTAPHDWVVRTINYSPQSPLYRDVRNTTMEMLYAQYVRYRPHS
ncbi:MAG TPA: histidine phosphatase family protein [Paraburkholderia sp.]|jgi:probable phosphoglycerate mutase